MDPEQKRRKAKKGKERAGNLPTREIRMRRIKELREMVESTLPPPPLFQFSLISLERINPEQQSVKRMKGDRKRSNSAANRIKLRTARNEIREIRAGRRNFCIFSVHCLGVGSDNQSPRLNVENEDGEGEGDKAPGC